MSAATDRAHVEGYQEALRDIADALDRGGADAVFQWVFDNARDHATRQAVRHLTGGRG